MPRKWRTVIVMNKETGSPSNDQKKSRNANVELLRCLLMFLIVLHHSAFHGYWKDQSSPWLLTVLFTALTSWHVDCFIAISGWFGIRFSWEKFLNLWGLIVFYSGVSVAVSLFMGWKVGFDAIISAGWFGGCYLMLMLIAPLLNAAIDCLHSQGKKILVKAWALMIFGVLMNWLPLHGLSGISFQGSYSVILMIVVYVTANVMRKLELKISKLVCAGVVAACMIGILLTSCVPALMFSCLGRPITKWTYIWYTTYDAPHVLTMALMVLYFFFTYVKVPEKIARIIVFCSPSMFGIYLLHETTSFGRYLYRVPEGYLADKGFRPCIAIVISAIGVFLVCLVIDIARRLMLGLSKRYVLILYKSKRIRDIISGKDG